MARLRFNGKQAVVDLIQLTLAFALVVAGHPFVAVLLAMVRFEAR